MRHTISQLKYFLTAIQIASIKPTIVDMANDILDDDSDVSVMTGESVGQTFAVNRIQTCSVEQLNH